MAHTVLGLRDIGAEAALLAGGGRAILLQLANPAVGHAVADHSDFAADPLRRLRNTLSYVYALVFGTHEQVSAVRSMVRHAHAPVRSETYNASDAALQLWVAATLYDTAATLHARIFGPLDEASLDAVYRDYAVVGTALGMPAALWPAGQRPSVAIGERSWRGSKSMTGCARSERRCFIRPPVRYGCAC